MHKKRSFALEQCRTSCNIKGLCLLKEAIIKNINKNEQVKLKIKNSLKEIIGN